MYDYKVSLGTRGLQNCLATGRALEVRNNLAEARYWYEFAAAMNPGAAEPLFMLGTLLLGQGDLEAAANCYQNAVMLDPGYVDAFVNLSVVRHQQHRLPEAVAACQRGLKLQPYQSDLNQNLGLALCELGDFEGAVAAYRLALTQRLADPVLYYQLGIALYRQGQLDEAAAHVERALTLQSGFPAAHLALGDILSDRGDDNGAVAHYRAAVGLDPGLVQAHFMLGRALAKLGSLDEALAHCRQAQALQPGDPAGHYHLGVVLEKAGAEAEAVQCYEQALRLNPNVAEAHYALGRVLQSRCDWSTAVARFERAISLRPNFAEAYLGLAISLEALGRAAEAMVRLKKALALAPNSAETHATFATTLLRRGEFAEGWHEFEWRQRLEEAMSAPRPQPRWNGEPLAGERILLSSEQGHGDTLQFVRYAPLIAKMGGRVVLEVQPELQPLLSRMPGVEQVVSTGAAPPDIVWQCPLMSLPFVLGTELKTVPAAVPYLIVDTAKAWSWAERLNGDGLRVGLVWAGNPRHKRDRERSIDIAALAPLGDVPGVRLFSLQIGARALNSAPPPGLQLTDLGPDLASWDDTAAAVSTLDLIISVDTAVAHLAGALGKPVWVLLPHIADWRWLSDRHDSPWYPTARLFRQPCPGCWDAVLKRVVRDLHLLAKTGTAGPAAPP